MRRVAGCFILYCGTFLLSILALTKTYSSLRTSNSDAPTIIEHMHDLLVTRTRSDGRQVPYFLWDRDVSVEEFRAILSDPDNPGYVPMLALLLREARPRDVWAFVSPHDVTAAWDDVVTRLGRRREFWTWVFESWRARGYVA